MWQLRLEDKRTIQQTLNSPANKKSTARVNRVPVFLGAGGESGVHPRSLLLLAGDIERNPGPGRERDILDSVVEHELCSEGENLDSSRDSGRGNTDTSGVDLGLLDTLRGDGLNSSSSLLEKTQIFFFQKNTNFYLQHLGMKNKLKYVYVLLSTLVIYLLMEA